jgi:hypothetical protein
MGKWHGRSGSRARAEGAEERERPTSPRRTH